MKKKIFSACILLLSFLLINSCKSSPDTTAAPSKTSETDKGTELLPSSGVSSEKNTGNNTITEVPAIPSIPPTVPSEPAAPAVIPPGAVTSAPPVIPADKETAVSTEMLTVPKGRADAAKKRAADFGASAYFPGEWNAANSKYTAAANMPKKTQSDVRQAAEMYDSAADDYDEIFRKTIPFYAKAKEDELIAAREKLINTGYAYYFPEYLQNADDKASLASSRFKAGDYYSAKDTADDALNEYEILYTGAKILQVRRENVDLDFVKYDYANFEKADETALAADEKYKAGNKKAAEIGAQDALRRYNSVLANGWKADAGEKRATASLEREKALKEKANIASRDLFREADSVFNRAEKSFTVRNFQDAVVLYINSDSLFLQSRIDTEEKRQRALGIIKLAEEKIEESNETAIDAERIIEGGTK